MNAPLDPGPIMQTGTAFMASKTLLSAVELELFTHLGEGPLGLTDIRGRLGLHPRSAADFLDALVALGFLEREGAGDSVAYANTPVTAAFLDKRKPEYIGGILEMANARLYGFWGDLTEALRTGRPQNEIKRSKAGKNLFEELYADPARLEQFVRAMAGIQAGAFLELAERFDFSKYESFCDVGGASGALAIAVAKRHPKVACSTFDLPPIEPIARRRVDEAGLARRVEVLSGDFFADPLPRADVIAMGNILHDWDLEAKRVLIRKAREALPEGGAFIAVENVIDDERRKNAFGLLMSLNMLIETEGGFDYTGADFARWCREAGFRRTEVVPLAGPASAAIAYA